MYKTMVSWAGFIVIAGLLAGCDFSSAFLFTPEDKINAAFPVSETVRIGKAAVLDQASGEQREEITAQFNTHLKMRALGCAKGYSPSWFTSSEEIRKKLGSQSCFTEADNEIARWLGLCRAGLTLAKPALKPVPKNAPSFIVADGYILNARFATNAGIALIETAQSIEIVDFETMNPIFRETKGLTGIGSPSPNGRLFTTNEGDRLKIKDAESGAVVAEIPSVRANQFYWLDERTALYSKMGSDKSFLVDFLSGKEIPVPVLGGGAQRVVRVPGVENQYVVFSLRAATKIELVRGKAELEVRLLAEKPIGGIEWPNYSSDATADGSRYFIAKRQFMLVSLKSLEIENIPLEPFYIQSGSATPDPDKIIFTGLVQGESSKDYLYSISNRTLMPIDRARLGSQRYLYIPSLRKQAVITDNKIVVVDEIPTLETIALSKFTSDALQVANLRKLEASDRQQTQQDAAAVDALALYKERVLALQAQTQATAPASAAPTPPTSQYSRQIGAVGGTNSPIANLARDAQVEAVGVYQGGAGVSRTTGGRKTGNVEVRIRRSAKPLVLVLSSYEPVQWGLISEPGARLAAVLVSGYYPSQVVGAGSARVIMAGNAYAYKLGSPEYNMLNRETIKWTGKSIGVFQGRYEGGTFSVGE